jgi:hypothetical protein
MLIVVVDTSRPIIDTDDKITSYKMFLFFVFIQMFHFVFSYKLINLEQHTRR